VEEFQTKYNQSRGKMAQFLAESLKEKFLEHQQNTYKLFKESTKYIVECQLTGTKVYSYFTLIMSKASMAADKSGDCTYVASWITCVLENVPDLTEESQRYFDAAQVNSFSFAHEKTLLI
jgi:hypothetical protein